MNEREKERKIERNNLIVKQIPVFKLCKKSSQEKKGRADQSISIEKIQCKCDQFVYPKNDDEIFLSFFLLITFIDCERGEWSL